MSGRPARLKVDGVESLDAVRRAAVARLTGAKVDSPELDVRVLLRHALDMDDAALVARSAMPFPCDRLEQFQRWLDRRAAGEPVARLVGGKEFWSRRFEVGPATLVPRPESETVIEAALAAFPDHDAALRVLDLGTGSGILLAAILLEMKAATGIGVDRSAAALATARRNIETLGLAERAAFVCGDWGNMLGGSFDLVVANPPYIRSEDIRALPPEIHKFDPFLALDGGRDGLDAYRAVVPALPRLLTARGVAVLELGKGQEAAVASLGREAGLSADHAARCDLAGVPRALILMATGEK